MQQKSNSVMECNSEKEGGLGWVGEKRRGERREKKWAGLVRLIASELCRKNKLSCRSRAALGWAERDCRSETQKSLMAAGDRSSPEPGCF